LHVVQTAPIGVPSQPRELASWLQVLSHLSPQHGGIAVSVPQLARATEAQGSHECPIVGFCDPGELEQIPADNRVGVRIFPPGRMRWVMDANLRKNLKNTVSAASGIHIHGIWETHCAMAAASARAAKRPYIISAHGMLEPWALRHKRLKKALYAALVETRVMQRAACLRALTVDEVDDYRSLGLTTPVAIVPSGVEVPSAASADLFRAKYPKLAGKRIVLFLGRIHHKKGLHILLQAWARIKRHVGDMHLVIAGPDSENTLAALERMTDELKLRSSVTFAGMLTGDAKWSAFAAANLLVLPSYSEGFSIAVLEALGMGVPVLVSAQCHIREVAVHDCGWVIQPKLGELEAALEEFRDLSSNRAAQMGERGKALARQRFDWSVVGKQMAQVYDWLRGGPKPSAVEIA